MNESLKQLVDAACRVIRVVESEADWGWVGATHDLREAVRAIVPGRIEDRKPSEWKRISVPLTRAEASYAQHFLEDDRVDARRDVKRLIAQAQRLGWTFDSYVCAAHFWLWYSESRCATWLIGCGHQHDSDFLDTVDVFTRFPDRGAEL